MQIFHSTILGKTNVLDEKMENHGRISSSKLHPILPPMRRTCGNLVGEEPVVVFSHEPKDGTSCARKDVSK